MAFNGHVKTLNDLAADRLFVGVPEVALFLNCDARTVRRAAEEGTIPAKKVGARWLVPVAWLRQEAGLPEPAPAAGSPDPDEFADLVADRLVTRLALLLTAAQPEHGRGIAQ